MLLVYSHIQIYDSWVGGGGCMTVCIYKKLLSSKQGELYRQSQERTPISQYSKSKNFHNWPYADRGSILWRVSEKYENEFFPKFYIFKEPSKNTPGFFYNFSCHISLQGLECTTYWRLSHKFHLSLWLSCIYRLGTVYLRNTVQITQAPPPLPPN